MSHRALKEARTMRNKARSAALRRKEEYLGARVSRELRDKMIARANRLGLPVSILIRNILEDAVGAPLHQDHEGTGRKMTSSPVTDREEVGIGGMERFPSVIGWEMLTLNRAMTCHGCGNLLAPGNVVSLGLAEPGKDHVVLCAGCRVPGGWRQSESVTA